MIKFRISNKIVFFAIFSLFLTGCNGKLLGGDARKTPADPAKRIEQNLKEGRGFRLNDSFKKQGGVFEFASSNPLWKASLDIIDFMPLSSVNYSGGIIITDWYSDNNSSNESIKISIRFLTNDIRADALDIKVFNRNCKTPSTCVISEKSENIIPELNTKILKTAAIYDKQQKEADFKPK